MFLRHLIRGPSDDIQLKFYGDCPRGTPPSGELNTRGVFKYSDFGPFRGYISQRCKHKFKTRNSSGDEIANVNFLYDDIVHVLQNTIIDAMQNTMLRDKIGGKLLLITDRKSYIGFRLVPKSVTLNDLERRNFANYFVEFGSFCGQLRKSG